ncbi:thiamine biosynthesis protein ThiJ [Peribacillus muralis]|uniref:Thiamine biosynthesis protein ThiJ n=2 Tax=Peribacillus muralis TaxID=264697 RepID=A0A1B3XNG5_9BACI|nr:DJ-1/PfpI family protein [Peribacillus muralis]AOH54751.1 thiamine biosynthesis protein ThiJ [Peribacillus muralis]
MMHIQVVLFDGFDLLDAIAPYEVFTAAAMYTNQELTVELVTAEGKRMVKSGINDLMIPASGKLDVTRGGIILVPGASGSVNGDGPDSVPTKLKRAMETDLSNMLKNAFDNSDILVSTVCGGSLILAMKGLLVGRHAVTHHMGMELLAATDAIPINARIVDDGNLVTGGGVTSGIDVALYLIDRELGPRIAHAVEQLFEYERRGTVWRAVGDAPKEEKEIEVTTASPPLPSMKGGLDNTFVGEWDTTLSTPIGKLTVLLNLFSEDGRFYGTAKQGDDIATLENLIIEGDRLKWSMLSTKPMRLNLKFSVSVNGDSMSGEAKAGMLPSSKLVGHRVL